MPQPGNCSTAVKITGQTDNNKMAVTIGSFLFICLTFFFCIELTLILVKDRPFHLFWTACLLLSATTGYFAQKNSPDVAKKTRERGFIFIMVIAALFTINYPVPISSVSITMRPLSKTTEFILHQFRNNHVDTLTKRYKEPSQQPQTINFRLPNALKEKNNLLRLYLGHRPNTYDIIRISFGTLILWQPIALTSYTGNNILKIAGTERTLNHFDFINNSIVRLASIKRSRPILNISTDESKIREDITPGQIYAVKLLWLFLYAGSSGLIIWGCTFSRLKIPGKSALIQYLVQ